MWWDRYELPAYCCKCGGTRMLVPVKHPYPAYLCTFCFWTIKEEKEKEKLSTTNKGQPYKCPVCEGKGLVSGGFYTSVGVSSVSNHTTEPCRSCDGKGIIQGGG